MTTRRKRVLAAATAAVVLAVAALLPAAPSHLRALYVLAKMTEMDPNAPHVPGFFLHPVAYGVAETQTTFAASTGNLSAGESNVRARLYLPLGVEQPRGMVIVHGVHRLGMDEPRLVAFARYLAATGIEVMTPEVTELKDFRIAPQSIATIGAAAQELARRTGKPVGIFGLSFAGGLALLTAADPRYAASVAYVFSTGGHADMARVARFYATGRAPRPDGSESTLQAHPYGAMVLIYAHPEDFFSPAEAPIVKAALHLALDEREAEARTEAARLSPASRARLESLAVHWDASPELRAALLRSIALHAGEMAAVSPAGKLAGLRTPVYLLHGAGDNVIPATESEWLARELPAGHLRALLVSPAISHVETAGKPTREDEWHLVHFLAQVLEQR